MSKESRHLDFFAAARSRDGRLERRTIAKYARQHQCGVADRVENCVQFDPFLAHSAEVEVKDFVDKMKVCGVVPRPDTSVSANKGADDPLPLRARWVAQ